MSRPYRRAAGRYFMSCIPLIGCLFVPAAVNAYTLWSSELSIFGTGTLLGPGTDRETQLSSLVLHNIIFVSKTDFHVPFSNNGAERPNICADPMKPAPASGKLSNGDRINESVDACPMGIAGAQALIGVAAPTGETNQPEAVMTDDGQLILSMDASIDFGDGKVVRLPLYFTTGTVNVPQAASAALTKAGAGVAGRFQAGATISGRIGDQNADGWIDGTLVATAVMPPNAPVAAGKPFVIMRNFELDIPVAGIQSGNIKRLAEAKSAQAGR